MVSFCAPNYLSLFYIKSGLISENDYGFQVLKILRPFNIFQNVSIFYITFVSFLKCPDWWKSYILFGPWIHAFIVFIDFFIIPFITCFVILLDPKIYDSIYSNYLFLNAIISICVIIWAPFSIGSLCLTSFKLARNKMN